MDIQPDLSVCIFGLREEKPLALLLDAVDAAADPLALEAVVVTGPRPAAALDARFPRALFFETERDESLPVAGNRALRLASGRYLALFTAASRFPPNGLRQLVTFLDERPDIGLAGPRLRNGAGATLPSAGFDPSVFRLLAAAVGVGATGSHLGKLTAPAFSREVDWLFGNGLIIRREVMDEVGLLAEELPRCWDLEYGLRARRAGWHAMFLHEVSVVCPGPLLVPAGSAALLTESGCFLRRRWRDHS